MDKSWKNIAIALAGTTQAIYLVEKIAKTGFLHIDEFETAVYSLLEQNPDSVVAVFGNVNKLRRGLEHLNELLIHHRAPQNGDLLRYMLGAMHLQKRLSKRGDLLYILGDRLEKAKNQAEHFSLSHDNVVANIAEIYSDTISKFKFRIQVTGKHQYLTQDRLASQIRVLLFSAIRSITLWRQVGGSRWQLLLYRNKIIEANSVLLREAESTI